MNSKKYILAIILTIALPFAHGLLQSPMPVDASGDVILATGTVTLANTKLSLADSYAFFDFSTDMTPWIGETIEICPATAASKHYCVRGLVSSVGTGETYSSEWVANPSVELGAGPPAVPTNWAISGGLVEQYAEERTGGTGSYSAKCYNKAVSHVGRANFTGNIPVSTLTKLSVWIKALGSTTTTRLFWQPFSSTYSITPSWGNYGNYGTMGAAYSQVYIYPNHVDGALLDDISVKSVLSPSSTGHWIRKSASSSTDGDGWSQKSASFLANDSAGYYWRIIKSKADGTYTDGNASIASSSVRLATVDGGAMIEIAGKDLSAYSGVDAYTPPTANLQLHLKADSGCYTDAGKTSACTNDGDKAYTWADQSGNGNDAVQATEGYRPLYKTSIVGSLPAIRFDGSDDYFDLTSPSTVYTTYIVAKKDSVTNKNFILYESSTYFLGFSSSSNYGKVSYYHNAYTYSPWWNHNSVQAITMVQDSGIARISINGFINSGDSGVSGLIDIAKIGYSHLAGYYLSGDIYEILVYNTAHDDFTRTRIERYLAGKWGITSYQPTYAGTSPAKYMLALYDSAGKMATGYIGGPGAGETLGSELITDTGFDNATRWTVEAGWSVSGSKGVATSASASKTIYQPSVLSSPSGKLYKSSITVDSLVNTIAIRYIATVSGPTISTTGNHSYYFTGVSSTGVGLTTVASSTSVSVDSATVKQITDISTSGIHLHSSPNATDRKMARVDSGFNPNAVTSYKIYQIGPSGFDLDVILDSTGYPIISNPYTGKYISNSP